MLMNLQMMKSMFMTVLIVTLYKYNKYSFLVSLLLTAYGWGVSFHNHDITLNDWRYTMAYWVIRQ